MRRKRRRTEFLIVDEEVCLLKCGTNGVHMSEAFRGIGYRKSEGKERVEPGLFILLSPRSMPLAKANRAYTPRQK